MPDANCSLCGGTGFKIVEREGLTGATPCSCGAATRSRHIWDNSRIPSNYEQASLENFVLPQNNPTAGRGLGTALLNVKGYARDFPAVSPPGLLLMGEPGTGKTHLAVGAMKRLLENGHECLFFDYQNLLDRIRAGYDPSSGTSDREAYRAALDVEVLVLDDLGAHRITDWVEDTVTAIITHRCNHKKPLIATTNLSDPETGGNAVQYMTPGGVAVHKKTLSDLIGSRARSRLFEMCRIVRMPAVEDYRVKTAR